MGNFDRATPWHSRSLPIAIMRYTQGSLFHGFTRCGILFSGAVFNDFSNTMNFFVYNGTLYFGCLEHLGTAIHGIEQDNDLTCFATGDTLL